DAQCQCRPNFRGRFCDEPSDKYCSMINCVHGNCIFHDKDPDHYFYCECEPGYGGPNCNVDIENLCSAASTGSAPFCQNGGTCTVDKIDPYRAICLCPANFTGPNCEEPSCSCP
ncbi:unnamed protein product, partial [Owenia fusiformis]